MEGFDFIALYNVDKTVMRGGDSIVSPSSITIGSESSLNVEKLLRSVHMWCDALDSVTHFRASVAEPARAKPVSQMGSQSQVEARAAVSVAFFTFHHSFICLYETQSTLT